MPSIAIRRYARIFAIVFIIFALTQTLLVMWEPEHSINGGQDLVVDDQATKTKGDVIVNVEELSKYLTCIFGMWTGMANNIISIQTSLAFAMRYNRTLIVPPLDNWEVVPSYWFSKVDNASDLTGLDRQLIKLEWGSDAFKDPYRRFSKYFQFESPAVNIVELSDLDPAVITQSPLRDRNISIVNDGAMWCWQNPGYDRDFPETMEEKYPVSKWNQDDVACIGIPFEIRLRTARPKFQFTAWVIQQAAALLDLNGLKDKKYLGIHLRRGNWDEYSSHGRFASSTYAKGSLVNDPVERRAPRDEHVIKAGEILRKRLALSHGSSDGDFPVVVTTNEKNATSIQRFESAGWIVLTTRLPDIPEFAQVALDLAVLAGATGFLGQYASTFTLLAMNMRDCDIEAPEWPCGVYFGDPDIV